MSELNEIATLPHLQDTIRDNGTVVVEFGAEWCGPCKKFLPHFVEFAKQTPEVMCVKVDIDTDPDIVTEFKIQSVPQVMLFKDGKYERHLEARTVIKLSQELQRS